MNTMLTLVRREFWEHRALWITPLVTAAILVLLSLVGTSFDGGVRIEINGDEKSFLDSLDPTKRGQIFGVVVAGLLVPQLIAMLIVLTIYLLDCLYAERKDRSILFWKSMPVSDSATVWSKFVTAIGVLPLAVYAVSVVTSLLCFAVFTFRFHGTPFENLMPWNGSIWLRTQAMLFVNTIVAALWYAPVAAVFMAISAWARRSVYLWVALPPVLLIFAETRLSGTHYVADFLAYRLGGFFAAMGMGVADKGVGIVVDEGSDVAREIAKVYEHFDASNLMFNVDLWLGVAFAAALLFGIARLRRYRDDT